MHRIAGVMGSFMLFYGMSRTFRFFIEVILMNELLLILSLFVLYGGVLLFYKLFGAIPVKSVEVDVVPRISLCPGGMPFGVKFGVKFDLKKSKKRTSLFPTFSFQTFGKLYRYLTGFVHI